MTSDDKSTIIWVTGPLCIFYFFFLLPSLLSDFFLYLWSSNSLVIMYLNIAFLELILLEVHWIPWIHKFMSLPNMRSFQPLFIFFLPNFLLSFQDSHIADFKRSNTALQVPQVLVHLKNFFSFGWFLLFELFILI